MLAAWLATCTICLQASGAPVLQAADFGALPDDGRPDAAALQRALDAARETPGSRVQLEAGCYDLEAPLHLRGTVGASIAGAPGGGTVWRSIQAPEAAIGLLSENRGRVCVRDVTVDLAELPFCQGLVTARHGDELEFLADPAQLPGDPAQHPDLNHPIFGPQTRHAAHNFAVFTDPQQPGSPARFTPDFVRFERLPDRGPRQHRLRLTTPAMGVAAGLRMVVVARPFANAFMAWQCDQVEFERVRIWASPGMAFLAMACGQLLVRDCRIEPRPGTGREISGNSDGVHAQSCRRGPQVRGCQFRAMVDDCVTAYGLGMQVTAIEPDELLLDGPTTPVAAGDHLEFLDPAAGVFSDPIRVLSAAAVSPTRRRVRLVDGPWVPAVGQHAYNRGWAGDGLLVEDNRFRDIRGVGVRVKQHNVQILRNRFENVSIEGVVLDNQLDQWSNGLSIADVQVLDNVFDAVGFSALWLQPGIRPHHGAIVASSTAAAFRPLRRPLTRGLVVRRNRIDGWCGGAIVVDSAAAITVGPNSIGPPLPGAGSALADAVRVVPTKEP